MYFTILAKIDTETKVRKADNLQGNLVAARFSSVIIIAYYEVATDSWGSQDHGVKR